ncbi:Protein of unknown function [Propionibacterium freudenreichii subsp. freudenreichii]|uniref:Uncharacterized protein n=1 Tax=Propionibacterium freudenreichii subsp. shermanii (strain ATCC 9614 / DSM 4902 / CIP 103027 / NCIMB 8099 / CIRM-BIA1) TaxID=754252 RepID=D7GF75_PROFC|nr:Hypothetical protein PFREUD_16750 [Propionibacterium freudenreichii subsp. shermanii CIRM-BIA1]CDP48918.1 Protein of unknown function [Propionibacterium freudenreichii subsp. freudenreichii]
MSQLPTTAKKKPRE